MTHLCEYVAAVEILCQHVLCANVYIALTALLIQDYAEIEHKNLFLCGALKQLKQ